MRRPAGNSVAAVRPRWPASSRLARAWDVRARATAGHAGHRPPGPTRSRVARCRSPLPRASAGFLLRAESSESGGPARRRRGKTTAAATTTPSRAVGWRPARRPSRPACARAHAHRDRRRAAAPGPWAYQAPRVRATLAADASSAARRCLQGRLAGSEFYVSEKKVQKRRAARAARLFCALAHTERSPPSGGHAPCSTLRTNR